MKSYQWARLLSIHLTIVYYREHHNPGAGVRFKPGRRNEVHFLKSIHPGKISMAKLLYLEASPRREQSFSSRVAKVFLETYCTGHPEDTIDHYHLFEQEIPAFDQEAAVQKMQHIASLIKQGKGIEPVGKWAEILEQIDRLKSADKVLISSPMWNFSIPYCLKQWIDVIVQPGLTFGVNRKGDYVGLLRNKRMQLILSSGSDYAPRFPLPDDGPKTDFQRCYLEHISRYIGIDDVRTIKVAPTEAAAPQDIEKMFELKLSEAREAARVF
jgi:FMN-dependent NADH-azoreductase